MIGKSEASPEEIRKAEAKQRRASKKALKQRQERDAVYDKFNVEESTLSDGTVVRSRLEALWFDELSQCESFECVECSKVPLWIDGPYGRFLSNYKPDFTLELPDGTRMFVELKPNHDLAIEDDRQKRALELNPKYKFVVIGGYPYSQKGVTVRLLTGKKEVVQKNVSVSDVLKFLGCQ